MLIGGEPGAGKSRLVEEAADEITSGALVLWGRAWEAGAAAPFWPWLQILRGYLRAASADVVRQDVGNQAARLVRLLPELSEALPEVSPSIEPDEEGARILVFGAVARILRRASDRQPMMIVLDDLHAADPSSLLLLRFLAAELTDARLVLVATYREQELPAGTEGRAVIGDLLRLPRSEHVRLRGLAPSDVDEYVRRVTGHRAATESLAWLVEETDGNPLFLTELIRDLQPQDVSPEGGLRFEQLSIPETVRDVIQRQLLRLSEGCRALLTTAAVLGREFRLDVLARVGGLEPPSCLEQIQDAVKERIVLEIDRGLSYRFSHVLVRDVVYETLPDQPRRALHRRAGEVTRELAGEEIEQRAGEIAYHFLLAAPLVDGSTAARYALLAGKHAVARLAYEDAARLFSAGLSAVDVGDELRLELLLAFGDALARAGEAEPAKRRFLDAATLAKKLGTGQSLAHAALGYGGRFVWEASRTDPHLLPLLTEALEAIGEGDSELRARLLARLAGGPLRDEPDRTRRERLSAEAVEVARRIGDPPTLAYALDGRYAATWGPDALEERIWIAEELIATARLSGDRERELQGHHYLCLALLEAVDLAGAEREAAEQRRLAHELQQPAQLFYVMTVDAMLATLQGRYADSDRLISSAFEMGQRAERAMAGIYNAIQRYALARERGTSAELLPELQDLAVATPTYVVLQSLIADAYSLSGRSDDAAMIVQRLAARGCAAVPRNDEWLLALTTLADAAAEIEERSAAAELYLVLLPYEERAAVSPPDMCSGAVGRALGRLAAVLGREDEARGHFERALVLNHQLRARPWVARTRYELGRLLLQTGDHDGASRLLREARGEARSLGMRLLLENAEGSLIGLGSSAEETVRTFLFTDIVGSTELLSVIGDEAWSRLLRWHDQLLRDLFAAHGGEEVHHAGDGFFVAFRSAAEAAACATAVQRGLAEHRERSGFAPQVRIGLHSASARRDAGGYEGQGVHQAARIAGAAAGGEILASLSALEGVTGERVLEERRLRLKGIRDEVPVAVIDWTH